MSAFGLPDAEPTVPLPEDIEVELIKSLRGFEQRFGLMAGWARQNGWLEDYAREIRRLAVLSYEQGRKAYTGI